jgi:hypothetical protein
MNYRQRFLEIQDFLKPFQNIWQNEIMLMYPDHLSGYPLEWIEDLRRIQDKNDVIRIEKKDVFDFIKNPSLINFYKRIEELSILPQIKSLPPMPEVPWTWLKIIPKKKHEIKRLAPYLMDIYARKDIQEIIDIGGGTGLLAQTLVNQYGLKVTSVDMNQSFQDSGLIRHKKNLKDPSNQVQFKNIKVESGGEFSLLLKKKVMPIGLHTCGRLALDIIKVSAENEVSALVNFGCCYHTLDVSEDLQNISKFSQENNGLWLNKFALTLAGRAHRKMDEKDYDFKLKVKFYRYAIHILLKDEYGIEGLIGLGNSMPKLYDESFGEYVYEQLGRINLNPKHTIEELNVYFRRPELILAIEQMLTAGHIRNALGRILEIYLLLDRAIYLEEKGYEVLVEEFFDEELSPRNIGITAVL